MTPYDEFLQAYEEAKTWRVLRGYSAKEYRKITEHLRNILCDAQLDCRHKHEKYFPNRKGNLQLRCIFCGIRLD